MRLKIQPIILSLTIIISISSCSGPGTGTTTGTTTGTSTGTTTGATVWSPSTITPKYTGAALKSTAISSANFTSYPLTLQPYEFRIIRISNYTEALADTGTEWWKDSVVYHVFVRSFKDSDGNGIGDLAGLVSKLDYITNIGFDAIWTLPIFESPSYHGYDISDYYAIEKDYGGDTAFTTYIDEAHKRNVKVILDMVINHSSEKCQWFVDSKNSQNNKRSWYIWTNVAPSSMTGWTAAWGGGSPSSVWQGPINGAYVYSAFQWGGMPDFNYKNSEVTAEIINVAKYWLDKGVDAYRMDAVRYLIEESPGTGQSDTAGTISLLNTYNAAVRSQKSTAFIIGEVFDESGYDNMKKYYGNMDSVFNFYFEAKIKSALQTASASVLNSVIADFPAGETKNFYCPFLDNHDTERFMTTIGNNEKKAKLAAAILMTFAGTPYVYYGTEIGMLNGSQAGDEHKRTPMQWDATAKAGFTTGTAWNAMASNWNTKTVAAQLADNNSLLKLYAKLIPFRRSESALRRGAIKVITTGNTEVLAYLRTGPSGSILVVANFSDTAKTVNLNFTGSGMSSSTTYNTGLYLFLQDNTNTTSVVKTGTSTYPAMYVRGDFNSWGTTSMNNYQGKNWTVQINIATTGLHSFKFDTGSWTTCWGYSVAGSTNSGTCSVSGGNITNNFTATGKYTFYFNDENLTYKIEPVSTNAAICVRGDFNSWVNTAAMINYSGNDWSGIVNVPTTGIHEFKFDTGNWTKSWGFNTPGLAASGICKLGGGNLSNNYTLAGSYTIYFNDLTLAYKISNN